VGSQLAEGCRLQLGLSRSAAHAKVLDYLDRVGLPDADRVIHRFPHQLSGGMRQRVMIAMALLSDPQIILCDEPTTALDVTIQAQILRLLHRICTDVGAALIFVSHDLAVIRQVCRDVTVMYAGRVAETGPVAEVFADPRHGYTASLLRSLPDMDHPGKPVAIPGEPPDPRRPPSGCRFHPRCPYAIPACAELPHQLLEIAPLRSSACIHGAVGLPAPEVMGAEAAIALLDDEEAVLETVDAEGAALETVEAEEAAEETVDAAGAARSSTAKNAAAQDVEAGR
jgi:oligopeptide/dipeptide ABC transporter ATP-binding protein